MPLVLHREKSDTIANWPRALFSISPLRSMRIGHKPYAAEMRR